MTIPFEQTLNQTCRELKKKLSQAVESACPKYKIVQLPSDKILISLAKRVENGRINIYLQKELERKKIWMGAFYSLPAKLSAFALLLPENMADEFLVQAMEIDGVKGNAEQLISEEVREKRVSCHGPFSGYKFLYIVLPIGQGYDDLVQIRFPEMLYEIRRDTIESDKENIK
jgi:hypothetical protein